MRFYKHQDHRFYAGVDLHARSMYLCILDQDDDIVVHKNLRADPKLVFQTIKPCRDGLVVAAECMFAWYWLADLCHDHHIPYVLGQLQVTEDSRSNPN
jgi:hypothetical protein